MILAPDLDHTSSCGCDTATADEFILIIIKRPNKRHEKMVTSADDASEQMGIKQKHP